MTVIVSTNHIDAGETIITQELEAFLDDPIGYGVFDHDDPITLSEFIRTRHHRGVFAAPLAF
jgi:hypothetical protein